MSPSLCLPWSTWPRFMAWEILTQAIALLTEAGEQMSRAGPAPRTVLGPIKPAPDSVSSFVSKKPSLHGKTKNTVMIPARNVRSWDLSRYLQLTLPAWIFLQEQHWMKGSCNGKTKKTIGQEIHNHHMQGDTSPKNGFGPHTG